ncbi:ABC transporter permease [Paenibacillus cymbidii]|uniref:ABC transporter permease n=1 Tax=Paenibacillus cymbidii TaxID=1639034 RepID=UPI0010819E9C|nr:ABC transporter permease subunit [Paenibacillus cymbidii]
MNNLAESGGSLRKRLKANGWLLMMFAPCFVFYVLFHYLPIAGIVISFKNYNMFRGIFASEWVGLRYYRLFLESPDFWPVLRNTFLLGVFKLVFEFPAPIALALLLNEVRSRMFKRFVQTVSYLPHFISNVVVASMLLMFLSPTTGEVNRLIEALGFEPINFMSLPALFRPVYVASEIWQHTGWATIIYLAALTAIDPQLYEAAEIDGAGRWAKMRHVTLPGILPVIVIIVILNTGKILEIGFEKVFLLYNPATYETADIIQTYVYRTGIAGGNYSYASAIGVFLGVVSCIFLFVTNRFARKYGETSLW